VKSHTDGNTLSIFLRNLATLYSANVFAKAGAIVLVVAAARYLGAEDFGRFSFIISFVSLGAAVTDFGINFYLIRTIARYQDKARLLVANATGLKIVLSALVVAAFWLLSSFHQFSAREALGLRVGSIILATDTLIQQIYAVFRGFQRMEFESLGVLLETTITVLLGTLLVVLTRNLVYLLLAYLLAKTVNFLVMWLLCKRKTIGVSIRFEPSVWKKLVRSSLPFALNIFLGLAAFRMDVVLLRFLRDPQQVGLYRAALSVVVTITIFAYMYQAAVFPVLSRLFLSSKAHLTEAIRGSAVFLLATGLLGTIVMFQAADVVVQALFGSSYTFAAQILRLLVIMLPIKFIDQVLGITLDSVDRQYVRPYVAMTAVVSNFLLNYFLIKAYGAKGAAVATVSTEAIVFVLYTVLVTRFVGRLKLGWFVARLGLATIGSLIVMEFVSGFGVLVRLTLSVATYLLLLLASGLVADMIAFGRTLSAAPSVEAGIK